MAKLKGPLFSLGAAGAIGKTLVYFGWKGLDVVREYVVPSNPQTAGQTTQRSYLTDAVAKIHEAQARAVNALDEDDQIAMSLLGSTRPTPRTWFNEQVKQWCDQKVAGKDPMVYSNGRVNDTTRTSVDIILNLNEEEPEDLLAGTWYMGKTKTNLVHTGTGNVVLGVSISLANEDISAWAAVGDKIFAQLRPDVGDPCEGANSGIYTFVAT